MIADLLVANINNYVVFNLLEQILEELLPLSHLQESLLAEPISRLSAHYHEGTVSASEIFATVTLVRAFFHAKLTTEKDPRNMLVFHGSNKVDLLPSSSKKLTWILK